LQEASDALVEEGFVTEPIKAWEEIPADVAGKLAASQVGFLGMLGRRRAAANGGGR